MMDKSKTVIFRKFNDIYRANIAKGVLESNGVPCFLSNESGPYNWLTVSSLGAIILYVFDKDLERANKIIESDTEIEEDFA